MFSRVYLNEQEAKDAATLTIQEILGNQNYLDETKFQKLHTEYRETSSDLESGIQSQILQSINKINQTKNYMDRCQVNLQRCEKAIKDLNEEFVRDQKIHREIMKYEKLAIYRRNISVMLDQMKYLFSVKEQIEQMKAVFESGSDPLGLHTKLLAMSEIRDSIKESINNGSFAKQDMDVILGEFQSLSDFENKFYGSIFSQLEHCLQLSIERPEQLIKVLQIVQSGDKGRSDEKFRKRALASIQKGIDDKFKEKLKEEKEAVVILENCKFTSGDLILVLDHTVRCFPPDYEIFKVYEERYRANIEMRIIPFLEDEDKVAQSFGTLINLLSWVDSYETLLSRVGENTNAYEGLRSKVKGYMPIFLDHVTNIIIDYSNKALLNDQQNQQKHAAIEQLIRNKQDLVTYFPEDIFHFINQQFDILGPKLKGEIMIEFIRTVSTSLAEVMRKECTRFINELPVDEDQSEFVSPLYMLILYVNNYYRCMTYSNETKQYCLQFVEQTYHERVEQIIYKDLTSVFNEGINMLLEHCVKLVLNEVGNQLIPILFTLEWQNQDIVTQSLMTAKDYLNDIEVLVIQRVRQLLH